MYNLEVPSFNIPTAGRNRPSPACPFAALEGHLTQTESSDASIRMNEAGIAMVRGGLWVQQLRHHPFPRFFVPGLSPSSSTVCYSLRSCASWESAGAISTHLGDLDQVPDSGGPRGGNQRVEALSEGFFVFKIKYR